VTHEAVTEIKRTEQQLNQLTGALLRSQDDERRRIARELHDATAQNLFALTMVLERTQAAACSWPADAADALAQSRSLAEQALQEIRTLSYLLHPPLLDEMGLASAVHWYVEGFSQRSGIPIVLDIAENLGRLSTDVEIALFRVLQAGLTNVHRHSGSATAHVRLTRTARRVRLQVRDRGHGMPTTAGPAQNEVVSVGVGFLGMRQRLGQLGGALDIRSGRRGTTITAAVPLTGRGAP
jgi:signal transduction histidine kinase